MNRTTKTRKLLEEEYKVFEKDGKFFYTGKRGIHPINIYISTKKHPYGKDIQYQLIALTSSITGKQSVFTYHAFLYAWYKGEVPAGYDVDHIDGDTLNNSLDNLQLLTRKENLAKRRGNVNQFGGKKPVYCLETGLIYESVCEASRQLGISDSTIVSCCKGNIKAAKGYHIKYA